MRIFRGTGPLPYTDPLRAGRHPFQTYMLALCVVSGLPLLFGRATSEAIEKNLPVWVAFVWGLMLFGGASTALVGSYWRGPYEDALTLERVGLDLTGGASIVYGSVILIRADFGGLLAAAIIFGFGLSCVRRARDISRIFTRANEDQSERVEREDEA